ncbi:LTA synthase family protein [uncultured Ferrovibrio sp.]|mgnify:CR=1 FL=1|jgi:Phosphoglycerol transferase and related proteins, alkaline phosphatase superfamily|uniref:LTA synthase family protein n=1 Tax=uncultured Ferrovibrio sp. TaxID=1576913 RepID=UPI002602BEF5|nr:LTA synthase family protein [uncultured Ferrovibrio sp.]
MRLPNRFSFWLLCIVVFVVISTLVRLGLATWIAVEGHSVRGLLITVVVGIFHDASMGLALGLPFLVGLYLLKFAWQRRTGRWLAHAILFAFSSVLIFSAGAEFLFWNEFSSRFNGIAVNYLIFPREVIGNIGESFNLGLYLPMAALIALVLYWSLRRRLDAALAARLSPAELIGVASSAPILAIIAALSLYWAPFGPSRDREINEVAQNGLFSMVRAFLTNDSEYDGQYAGMDETAAIPLLRGMVAQDNTVFLTPKGSRSLMRHVDNGQKLKNLNIVLVINESYGSTYIDSLDNKRGESISPNIDRLAKDGLLFTNVYATGDRTVRGLEALLTSFAPIPGISTARRSGSEGMNSVPLLLRQFGYRSAFLYAGDGRFDNMGHFWETIGFDNVWDERDFSEKGFKTIWGYADEYLYKEATARLDQMTKDGQPAFLAMLTVSNHRPYTYPEGRISKDPNAKTRTNAATYADWAFGNFVDNARGKPWFDNTVFVFIGDHGPKINGSAHVPVDGFRVPLLFYAPKHIVAARDGTLGSSLDMAPTLMGLLGISFDSPFFGIDLRRVPPGGGRMTMAHNFSVAFGTQNKLVVLEPNRTVRGYTFQPGPAPPRWQKEPDPEVMQLGIAQTQTAHRMFYARQYHDLSEQTGKQYDPSKPRPTAELRH